MKKLLFIAVIAAGLVFASAPRSEAGVSVGIGIGLPVVYPYAPYPYPYPYPYYGYYGGPSFFVGPGFYWYHGHRVFIARRPHHFFR
jgi:hypothetical protein